MIKNKQIMILNLVFWGILTFVFFYSSVHGIGVGPDSISFLGHAPSFAPLYNTILLFISDGIVDGADKAKYLNFALYIATTLILYVILYSCSKSHVSALMTSVAFALNKYILNIYLLVHNEALALFLTSLFFYFLAKHLQNPKIKILIVVAIIAGLIPPARYSFSSMLIVGGVFFLFYPNSNNKMRIINTAIYSVISVSITFFVLILNSRISLSTNTAAGRELAFNGNADMGRYLEGLKSLGQMFFPTTLGNPVSIFFAFIIIILIIVTIRSEQKELKKDWRQLYLASIGIIASALYALLLLVAVQIEANLPLYDRYMIPFILFFSLAAGLAIPLKGLTIRLIFKKETIFVLVILFLYFPANIVRSVKYVHNSHENGLLFSSLNWRQSPTIRAVKDIRMGKDDIILSNGPWLLDYLSGVKAVDVPNVTHRRTGKDFTVPYKERVSQMQKNLISNGGGYYVHFYQVNWRFYLPEKAEVINDFGFYPIMITEDGEIYATKQKIPKN